jgi:hypothetical protein
MAAGTCYRPDRDRPPQRAGVYAVVDVLVNGDGLAPRQRHTSLRSRIGRRIADELLLEDPERYHA